MSQFVVSARKYRPVEFEDVVGQQHITETLKLAISGDTIPQALLFCGPRGVGKTTCARILARKINEQSGAKSDEDFSFNILELDAASNNSVDDIRQLVEEVRYLPQVGKYRVFIIDEVHMLSTQAFNAFLKTLEEPPPHAVFILATTEKHKIIPTILSRCQIFDFKRIPIDEIAKHLKKICELEGINYEDDALYMIAQKADGALRDALSTFDRVVTFTQKNLTTPAVADSLNVLDYDYYLKIIDLALQNSIQEILLVFNEIVDKGFDFQLFIAGLANHCRNLLVGKDPRTLSLLEVGEGVREKYRQQSEKCSYEFLYAALDILNQTSISFKESKNQRLTVELALMQIASVTQTSTAEKKKSTA